VAARFDAIVIGTGQAGPALAARLSQAGMKVAVIERKRFGGTCVNTGCIPTKLWWRAPTRRTSRGAPRNTGSPSAGRAGRHEAGESAQG
jgi:pyruvate/2-oxoglutarate dehydrogenase complex dihydrolipoamide dehydrogenase (E3) component